MDKKTKKTPEKAAKRKIMNDINPSYTAEFIVKLIEEQNNISRDSSVDNVSSVSSDKIVQVQLSSLKVGSGQAGASIEGTLISALSGRIQWNKHRVLVYLCNLINEINEKKQGTPKNSFIEVQAGFRPESDIIDISANTNTSSLSGIIGDNTQSLLKMIKATNFSTESGKLSGSFKDFKTFRLIKYKYYLLGFKYLQESEKI